jgi:hypothetical protein
MSKSQAVHVILIGCVIYFVLFVAGEYFPEWVHENFLFSLAGMTLISLLLLFLGCCGIILKHSFQKITICSNPEIVPNERIRQISKELELLGFISDGPTYKIQKPFQSVVAPYVSLDSEIYVTIIDQELFCRKPYLIFGSDIDRSEAGLMTAEHPRVGKTIISKEIFCQIFPGENTESLYRHHQRAIEFLKQKGFAVQKMQQNSIERAKENYIKTQHIMRKYFLKVTLVWLWRDLTRKRPFLGPIMEQKNIEKQIQYLQKKDKGQSPEILDN